MEKDEIITKIKDVASLLDGKSPSIGDMEKYAGIKKSKWEGKYWTKWSDALIEAGYAPNRFSIPAIGKERIIVEILSYIKSINRIPTMTELKMHKRIDPNFPSDNTIKSNFSGKEYAEIKRELLSYCATNAAYSDLLPLFDSLQANNANKPEDVIDKDLTFGYVYMIQHGSRREYKIGKTNNVIRREGQISIELPEQVKPIHYIETDDPSGIEKYWHNRFREKRKNGEWFELSINDVKAFQKWKKYINTNDAKFFARTVFPVPASCSANANR